MSNITKAIAALGVVAGLGVAALPLSSYAAQSNDVTVRATIESNIAVTAADTLVDLGNVIANGPISERKTTVTVTTNNATGYTLKVVDADSDYTMNNKSGALTSIDAGVPTVGNSAWGIKGGTVAIADGGAAEYTAMKEGGLILANVATATGTTDDPTSGVTEVTFGVSAGAGLASGIYEDVVVFTAEANNGTN